MSVTLTDSGARVVIDGTYGTAGLAAIEADLRRARLRLEAQEAARKPAALCWLARRVRASREVS